MSNNKITRRRLLKQGGALMGLATLPSFALSACSAPINQIKTITFPGTYNLLLWVGQAKGFFANEQLDVSNEFTTTSMHLVSQLVGGSFAIASSSIDNVVAYNEGQGQVELDRPADLFAFMSLSPNMSLPLLVQNNINSFADLKGRSLAVDAISTGFSFVLRKMLEVNGLGPDDYQLVSVGNARDRLSALQAGTYAGALLTPPFDQMALNSGLKLLGSSRDAIPQYQAPCFVTTRSWANAHSDELVAFIQAILRVEMWLADENNYLEAGAILQENIPNLGIAAATSVAVNLAGRLDPDPNIEGIKSVLALRSQYATPQKQLSDPYAYLDLSYLETARATL